MGGMGGMGGMGYGGGGTEVVNNYYDGGGGGGGAGGAMDYGGAHTRHAGAQTCMGLGLAHSMGIFRC